MPARCAHKLQTHNTHTHTHTHIHHAIKHNKLTRARPNTIQGHMHNRGTNTAPASACACTGTGWSSAHSLGTEHVHILRLRSNDVLGQLLQHIPQCVGDLNLLHRVQHREVHVGVRCVNGRASAVGVLLVAVFVLWCGFFSTKRPSRGRCQKDKFIVKGWMGTRNRLGKRETEGECGGVEAFSFLTASP